MVRLISISFLIACFASLVSAQAKAGGMVSFDCGVSDITFNCPKGFEIKDAKGSSEPFLAIQNSKKIAVFAFSPTVARDRDAVTVEALSKTFAGLYGSNFSELKVKDSRDFSGDEKFSIFEKAKFAKAALDEKQNLAFHFQYVLLEYKKRQIVAGFIYDPAPPKTPTDWYSNWLGGGFGDASEALQDLIVLITKEKRPDFSPGGPPPPGQH